MLACGVVIPSGNVTLHSVNRGKAAILWPALSERSESNGRNPTIETPITQCS